ncbi:unnamed protein product [Rotaria sordida]|uniref:Uncharacterized protein n=1 Tax=Rotaria sordida TaxID=392033 RepID=A0A815EFX0_9BILA|nr:unnamed protein product [Rotaria sordida]CAF4114662.1 unnamed protein product [Rotaria sordida]
MGTIIRRIEKFSSPRPHPYRCISFDIYDIPGDNYPVQYNSNQPISLQNAIATAFGKFIDKSLAVNHWQCGLDLALNTWKNQLFSRRQYK